MEPQNSSDTYYMQEALSEARKAYKKDEVPIGAVCVYQDKIISRGHNLIERANDVIHHAEIIAIKRASNKLKNWRLDDISLYTTVAPCIMCSGCILNSRISRLVYGANNDNFSGIELLKGKLEIISGVLEEEALKLMQDFFKGRRSG